MSIFNPYVLLGVIFAVLSAFGGGYYKGGHDEANRQQLEVASLNAQARQKEQALVAAVNAQATQLAKANQNAKLLQQKRNADIAAGVMQLRIPVKTPVCPVSASADAPTSSGVDLGTAELQPEAAQALVAITDDADATVRKLNTCINLYNEVRQTLKEKP
jgi:flagellar capping protein FliD